MAAGTLASSANAAERYIGVRATGTVKVKPDTVRLNATVAVVAGANKDALAGASASAQNFAPHLAQMELFLLISSPIP